jgi:hypothetical protein
VRTIILSCPREGRAVLTRCSTPSLRRRWVLCPIYHRRHSSLHSILRLLQPSLLRYCQRVSSALRQREMHGTRVICPLRARVLLTRTGCDRPELKRLIVLRVRQFGHRALHRTASVQRARISRQALDCSGLSNVVSESSCHCKMEA